MAALKSDPDACAPKHDAAPPAASPLARLMREYDELVDRLETGLLRSLDDGAVPARAWRREDVRPEACRLAVAELSAKYARRHIRRSLSAAESRGRRVEQQLHRRPPGAASDADGDELRAIGNGYFRLYSTELFDLLGQPTDVRFGTLRFRCHSDSDMAPAWVSVELALGSSFFVADSLETLPFHDFKMPSAPSLQNRGILSRKPDDHGAFPDFDSWLLFTFLGRGCLKLEVPVEMCADVYGGPLRGRENEEVQFWGFFVDDDDAS